MQLNPRAWPSPRNTTGLKPLALLRVENAAMSKPFYLLAALTTFVLMTADARAAVATTEVTEPHFDSYLTSDGTPYFALSLAPNVPLGEASGHDVVILFDTSASQTSVFRDRALEALSVLLTS